MKASALSHGDAAHVWHPYSGMFTGMPVFPVLSATGVYLQLEDGRRLIDGMASWWCAIHGYNHPRLNAAINAQLQDMAHVMFGGLTHPPAVNLAQRLVALTPAGLEVVFFADSGSVAVEVAMKMAVQYQRAIGHQKRRRFLSLRGGYHGDTLGAMSVCDPVTGMHRLYAEMLPQQIFAPRPGCRFGEVCTQADLQPLQEQLHQHRDEIAAVILEPIVQGAGGMFFYAADYLTQVRQLCDQYGILLIADEIATGFGRSGKLFACEHADISPDILCLGKALTGGYMTLAATLTRKTVAESISGSEPGVLMHGPTFMANPLACATALASLDLLFENDWQQQLQRLQKWLKQALAPCTPLPAVKEVRVLGGIGVVELHQPVDMRRIQPTLVDHGVWIRPFGHLVYLMPPYIIKEWQVQRLGQAIFKVLNHE